MLKGYFPEVIDVEFTAAMEDKLDAVEDGRGDWVHILKDFYDPFKGKLARADSELERIKVADEVSDETCEKCGRQMVIKSGRFGAFLACPGFPDCRNTRRINTGTGVPCPKCGEELVLRRTKSGRSFFGCKRYPLCDFSTWYEPVKEKCPNCGGLMVRRKSKQREFVACSDKECGHKTS
jgi:DNA topoisomerase-1